MIRVDVDTPGGLLIPDRMPEPLAMAETSWTVKPAEMAEPCYRDGLEGFACRDSVQHDLRTSRTLSEMLLKKSKKRFRVKLVLFDIVSNWPCETSFGHETFATGPAHVIISLDVNFASR